MSSALRMHDSCRPSALHPSAAFSPRVDMSSPRVEMSGGVSRLSSVEFLCAALGVSSVVVLVYGDFDPGGWLNGRVFVDHLGRYGVVCPGGPVYLVRPELYTAEELELFSRPLSSKDGRVDEWLEESGGIGGEARGIHCDWLQPPERLSAAIAALIA